MRVLVVGANGRTGRLVCERANAKGYEVTAFVRAPGTVKFREFVGNAMEGSDVRKAMVGIDVVIDTIGGTTPYKDTVLERTAATNLIAAMQELHVRRIIAVSMMGLGDSVRHAPFWYRRILMPTFLRGSSKDKAMMEREIQQSGLDFVIARPAILSDGKASGKVKVLDGAEKGSRTDRADLAAFIVDQLGETAFSQRAVTIVSDRSAAP